MKHITAYIAACFFIFLLSCENSQQKKELVIYCGITMVKPINEICKIVEQEENCEFIVLKGGTGNLLNSINYNKKGDLFLPGSDSYYKQMDKGIYTDTVWVGDNIAAILVQKGNPKNISNDLNNLKKPIYLVAIGNSESGSIGKETKSILEKKHIYNEVVASSYMFTTDSKDLIKAIKNKEADMVINWYATSLWDENRDFIEALTIDENYVNKRRLVLGTLKYTKHPDITKRFMEIASSDEGRKIFKKYGFIF